MSRNFIKLYWPLLIVLPVLIGFKIPHLFHAYYWDECWPYALAIKQMSIHGLSFLPAALEPDLSRGHPLFFHVAGALWMDIFGGSHVSMHSFALFISASLMVFVYHACLTLFNQRVAIMALLLVALQVAFFVQSSFVLPDVLVALLAIVSIYYYSKAKYLMAMVCVTMLFFTKESGLLVGAIIGIDAVIGLFRKATPIRSKVMALTSVAVPCVLMGIFYLLQKQANGWYLFPVHTGSIKMDWLSFFNSYSFDCIHFVFDDGYRYYYYCIILFLSVVVAIKTRKLHYLIWLIPGILVYAASDRLSWWPGNTLVFFILFQIATLLAAFVYGFYYDRLEQRKFIILTIWFVMFFLSFSAINFITVRYLLVAIIPLVILAAIFIDYLIQKSFRFLFYPVLLVIAIVAYCSFTTDAGHGDCNLQAFEAVLVQEDMVDFLEKNNMQDKNVFTGGYLQKIFLDDLRSGFLKGGKAFKHVNHDINDKTEVLVFDNLEYNPLYNVYKSNSFFKLIHRFEKEGLWNEIYLRKD